MPETPIIQRGERYFCSQCNHLMDHPHASCPLCGVTFDGAVEEKPVVPEVPEVLKELEEEYEELSWRRYIWTGIVVLGIIGVVALVVILLISRR
ncbi:MAG: hypothetical protein ABIK44_03780 [candidate division WOR-3 bacterium]